MKQTIQFETPENVVVRYEQSGLGTRFVAWIVDQIILGLALFLLFFGLLLLGIAGSASVERFFNGLANSGDTEFVFYMIGIFYLIYGFGNLLYYGLMELFMHGQTVGKRIASIRVVKSTGFQLDAGGIIIRTVFRVLDHLPPMWLVPFMTQKSQRLGDLVAGTVVIRDRPADLADEGRLRERLMAIPREEMIFRIDTSQLSRLDEEDLHAAERLLLRWPEVDVNERARFASHIAGALAIKLNLQSPNAGDEFRFLEEILATEYRRQYRQLG